MPWQDISTENTQENANFLTVPAFLQHWHET
jgi:hypothetical protein